MSHKPQSRRDSLDSTIANVLIFVLISSFLFFSFTVSPVLNVPVYTQSTVVTPAGSLNIVEVPGTGSFDVSLDLAIPNGETVEVTVSSQDTLKVDTTPAGGVVLNFDDTNWNIPQTVSIQAVDDADAIDESVTIDFDITSASVGSGYTTGIADTRTVVVEDSADAGYSVTGSAITQIGDGTFATNVYDVVLDAQPENDVIINVVNSDPTRVTFSQNSFTFTNSNWDTAQDLVTTTVGTDADLINDLVDVTFSVDGNSDGNFTGLANQEFDIETLDSDTATITVNPGSITVSENAGTDTFTVVLGAEPQSDVVVDLSSQDTAEGTVSPSSLTFTTLDWDTPQTVTVTGVDDDTIGDDSTSIDVVVDAASSDDDFDLLSDTVGVTFTSEDVAGFTVSPTTTTQDEGIISSTFTVTLDAEPVSDVIINAASNNTSALTVSPSSLTFTAGNWDTPQFFSTAGVEDDNVVDEVVTVDFTVDLSSDADFLGLSESATVTVNDNDTADLSVDNPGGISVSEGAGGNTFDVVLTQEPQSNVVVTVTSSDTGAATADVSSLTFTDTDWDTPQTVTVTAVADSDLVDESVIFTFAIDAASSDDDFDAIADVTRVVTVLDSDSAGLSVTSSTSSLSESQTFNNHFSVDLIAQPQTDVVVEVVSSDPSRLTVSPTTLTFTNGNWDTLQFVDVTTLDDADLVNNDVDVTFSVVDASSDDDFDGLSNIRTISVLDDDSASIYAASTTSSLTESSNSYQSIISVQLSNEPQTDVVIDVTSTDTTRLTATPAQLTFTPANWDTLQYIDLNTIYDDDFDDNQASIDLVVNDALSDNDFDGLSEQLTFDIEDNTAAEVIVNPDSITLPEGGLTDTFTVVLSGMPTSDVVIDLTSQDTTEATISPSTLTFTSGNWNTPQTVTITSVDDEFDRDDSVVIDIIVNNSSSDDEFDGLGESVSVTLTDDDTAALLISPVGDISIEESETQSAVAVSLTSDPVDDVLVEVTSGDTNKFVVISGASLTFTSADWQTPQFVTLQGVADQDVVDDTVNLNFTVNNTFSSTEYNGITETKNVVVVDEDIADISVDNETGIIVTESVDTGSFDVVLDYQPSSDVVVTVTSSDTGAAIADMSSLTFTSVNWATPQTVTISPVDDDDLVDESVTFTFAIDDANSDDDFDAIADVTRTVDVLDSDTAGLENFTASSYIDEGSSYASMAYINLSAQPQSDVVIDVTTDDPAVLGVSPTQITFTSSNWDVPVNIDVNAPSDDDLVDGSAVITYTVNDALSDDDFDGLTAQDTIYIYDTDSADVVVTPSNIIVPEDGVSDTFDVVLDAEPQSDVVIDIAIDNPTEGTLDITQLTFTPSNWDTPQTVTLTAINDNFISDDTAEITISVNNGLSDSDFEDLEAYVNVEFTDDDVDTDGDLVTDDQEADESTDPNDPLDYLDTDGDLVPDFVEDMDSTDSDDMMDFLDTDTGGTPDYVETTYRVNAGLIATDSNVNSDDGADEDGDLVTDYSEWKDGTDVSDGLDFTDEDGDLVPKDVEMMDGTSDNDDTDFMDTDGGGTPDYVETTYRVNAGLTATDESVDTDDATDLDGGSVNDYEELKLGSDVNNSDDDGDVDTDNVDDSIEDNGPNGGDANGDGIMDSEQANVASNIHPDTGDYVAVELMGDCNTLTGLSIETEGTLGVEDEESQFDQGLTSFSADCSVPGAAVTVNIFYDQVYDTGSWVFKKFNPTTAEYTDISSAVTYSTQTVGVNEVTVASYEVVDGGALDLDGLENGQISDPAGPSTEDPAFTLLRTGGDKGIVQKITPIVLISGLIALSGIVIDRIKKLIRR